MPDPDQVVLIYCRSGRRSKEAAQKLWELGYRRVYEFGGIIDWDGETVVDNANPEETETASALPEENGVSLVLSVDGREVPVRWEDNESVAALRELAAAGTVRVEASAYGGFEQVGPLGYALPRNDENVTTRPGDVVLYSGNQIVVFFGTNNWSYTRLGHIDLSQQELRSLLNTEGVTLELSARSTAD